MTEHAPLAAVVFDLDGVLVDSESLWDASRRAVVAAAGGHWEPGATREMMGMNSPEWSAYLHERLGVPLDPAEIADRVVAMMVEHYRTELPLLPGAVAAVRRMAERWPVAIASSANVPVIAAAVSGAGLDGVFGAVVSADEVTAGKPAPDVYLEATRRLGVEPAHAVGVEDSTNGLRAAAAARMLVVAIPNREFPPDAGALALASLVIGSLDELTVPALLAAAGEAAA